MSKGVLLFAQNNLSIDYVKQSVFCAKRIKKYLDVPVCLVTTDIEYLKEFYKDYQNYFEHIVVQDREQFPQYKKFRDGLYSEKKLEWHNLSRADAFYLTPFDETIVMDTDVILCNNVLSKCFDSKNDFMITKHSQDIKTSRNIRSFNKISDRSIDMLWATLFYFKKNENTKIIFDLVKHIKENYNFYRLTYKITEKKFRNDFAFSIAIHILNGFKKTNWPLDMPGKLWHTLDKDILVKIKQDQLIFLLEKDWEYHAASVQGLNVHVMNKFSLNRMIDEQV